MSNGTENPKEPNVGTPTVPVPQPVASPSPPPGPAAGPAPGTGPDLEDAGSRALSEALRSSFGVVKVIMVLLVIVFFASGVFTVPSQQRAIILRMGKPVGAGEQQLLGPGLHWSYPAPIDEIVRIPIAEIQTVSSTAGWYQTSKEAEEAGQEPEPGASLNPAVDGYTITSDANIIHVRADLQYRIQRPLDYVLNFVSAASIIQNDLDEALFYASSQFKVDQALRENKLAVQEMIAARVRELAESQKLGITVEGATVNTLAPRQVKQSFDDVSKAETAKRIAVDEANAYAGRLLSTAQGEAAQIQNAGRTDGTRLVQQVAAEARYFLDQLPHYKDNPELFKARLQAEAMTRILTNTQDKFFLPARSDGNRQLWLMLNRDPRKPLGTNEVQQGQNR
jgi:membrane protease subunit HflK